MTMRVRFAYVDIALSFRMRTFLWRVDASFDVGSTKHMANVVSGDAYQFSKHRSVLHSRDIQNLFEKKVRRFIADRELLIQQFSGRELIDLMIY